MGSIVPIFKKGDGTRIDSFPKKHLKKVFFIIDYLVLLSSIYYNNWYLSALENSSSQDAIY